jgi:hypothetical protein
MDQSEAEQVTAAADVEGGEIGWLMAVLGNAQLLLLADNEEALSRIGERIANNPLLNHAIRHVLRLVFQARVLELPAKNVCSGALPEQLAWLVNCLATCDALVMAKDREQLAQIGARIGADPIFTDEHKAFLRLAYRVRQSEMPGEVQDEQTQAQGE